MLGKLHFVTAALFFAPLGIALFSGVQHAVALSIIFVFGALVGVLLPDSDSHHAVVKNSKFEFFGFVTKYFLYLPLALVCYLLGFHKAREHRGVMHSALGALSAAVFWGAAAFLLSKLLGINSPLWLSFASGLFLGYVFHLLQDSLTVSGVRWLYPLGLLVRGRISMHYSGLAEKTFYDSESYAALLFIIAAVINIFLASSAGIAAMGLVAVSLFELAIIAAMCRLEAVRY